MNLLNLLKQTLRRSFNSLFSCREPAASDQGIAPGTVLLAQEGVRRCRNLRLLIGLISAGAVLVLLLIFFTPPIPAAGLRAADLRVAAAAATMLLAAAIAVILRRFCSVEAAAFVYLCLLTVVIALGDTPDEAAAGRTLVVFAVPILAAGAVLPAWTPFIFAALSTLAIWAVGRDQIAPLSYMVAGLTFFVLAGVAWLSAASLARSNSALRSANLHLRQRENDFHLLFADNPLPMVLIDLHSSHIIEANQAAITQSGFDRAALLDYPPDAADPVWRIQSPEAAATIARGETLYEEQQHHTADGKMAHVAIMAHRVVYGGQSVALVIAQDITARRNAEEALRALNTDLERRVEERTAELREVNAALERSSRHKDEFLATMSHELRTPLTGILGSADVLAGERLGPLAPQQERAVQLIQESGQHLLSLINSVLDLSKLEVGRLLIDIEPLLARDVCLSALHMVQEQARGKEQIVTYASTPNNFWLQADGRRLKQILINLLGNAVKFTPENGSIRLDVEADFVQGTVTFCVTDNGIGIAADDLPHLFEPFYQINSGLSRLYGGAGLGLALVKRLAQLHGGNVEVSSTVGEGSSFTVTLPCRPRPLAPAPPTPPREANLTIPNLTALIGRRPNVLLAEDHASSVEVLRSILELACCDLCVVGRGDLAVEAVQSRQFDLILMDVQMPVMDGLTAIRAIRGLPGAAARTPVIALTAMALWGDRERCLQAGANDYISKPVDLDQLFAAMLGQLQTSRPA